MKNILHNEKKSIDINENWGMWQVSKHNEFTNKWHSVPYMQYYEVNFAHSILMDTINQKTR